MGKTSIMEKKVTGSVESIRVAASSIDFDPDLTG